MVIVDEFSKPRFRHRSKSLYDCCRSCLRLHTVKVPRTQSCFPYTWHRRWQNSDGSGPLVIDFKDTTPDAHSISFKGATPIYAVPKYYFTRRKDFEDFQSELRGKRLVGTFEVRKIDSAVSAKYGEATDQHLKIWKDYATKECSISFYASAISKPRDREFPLAMLEQEVGLNKKVKEELRLNFIRGTPETRRSRTVSRAFSRSPSEATTWTDTTCKSRPLLPSIHRFNHRFSTSSIYRNPNSGQLKRLIYHYDKL